MGWSLALSFVCFGAGALLANFLERESPSLCESMLIGLATIAGAGIFLNFSTAITPRVRVAFWAVAAVTGMVQLFRVRVRAVEAAAFAISLLYFVNRSLLTTLPYDTGFYQMQTVKWLEESRLFPGLAAVHSRIGFDSISLVVSALLHVSNRWSAPLLLGAVILSAAEAAFLAYCCTAPREKRRFSTSYSAVCACLLPWGPTCFDLGSLSTDIVPCVVILFCVFWVIRLFEGEAAPAYLALCPRSLSRRSLAWSWPPSAAQGCC